MQETISEEVKQEAMDAAMKDPENTWLTSTKFTDTNVNHPMPPEAIEFMQGLVQRRVANSEFTDMFPLDHIPEDQRESAKVMATYIHTCYELGVEAGMNNVDKIINQMLDKTVGDKNETNTESPDSPDA